MENTLFEKTPIPKAYMKPIKNRRTCCPGMRRCGSRRDCRVDYLENPEMFPGKYQPEKRLRSFSAAHQKSDSLSDHQCAVIFMSKWITRACFGMDKRLMS